MNVFRSGLHLSSDIARFSHLHNYEKKNIFHFSKFQLWCWKNCKWQP